MGLVQKIDRNPVDFEALLIQLFDYSNFSSACERSTVCSSVFLLTSKSELLYTMENRIINKKLTSFIVFLSLAKKKTAFPNWNVPKSKKQSVLFLEMMCYTGLRINEILSLTKFSYNSETKSLTSGEKNEAEFD